MSIRHTMASEVLGEYAADFADQSWRSFGMDTEAGRLLNKPYAGSQHKPKINYPAVRRRCSKGPKPKFIPGGGKASVDLCAHARGHLEHVCAQGGSRQEEKEDARVT